MVKCEVELHEQDDSDVDLVNYNSKVPVHVMLSDDGITIEARDDGGAGFSVATVSVEFVNGKLRLLVWDGDADTTGDPTHDITVLEDAHVRINTESFDEDDEDDDEDELDMEDEEADDL
jgi:hypothetical protein